MNEVLVRREGPLGILALNRPAALNALTLSMCEALIEALLRWREDPGVELVLLEHAGERGFCAGGDIRMLAESGASDGLAAQAFFRREYQLNALLMAYPKPIVVFMDGVVMGGGVGLALPCPFRVATERTAFAMPETGIGLFPDVGGGWHLPRLAGASGMRLALAGLRLKAAGCVELGLAGAYAPSGRLPALKAELGRRPDEPAAVLARFCEDPPPLPGPPTRPPFEAAYAETSVEGVLEALAADGGELAQAERETLLKKSPQTLKVAHRQLTLGGAMTRFEAVMAMEFRIACRVVARHDFQEGVRAVIIDKDQAPRWRPERLSDVSETLLDEIFAPLASEAEWRPLEISP